MSWAKETGNNCDLNSSQDELSGLPSNLANAVDTTAGQFFCAAKDNNGAASVASLTASFEASFTSPLPASASLLEMSFGSEQYELARYVLIWDYHCALLKLYLGIDF